MLKSILSRQGAELVLPKKMAEFNFKRERERMGNLAGCSKRRCLGSWENDTNGGQIDGMRPIIFSIVEVVFG